MTTPLVDLVGCRLPVVGGGSGIGSVCVDHAIAAGAHVAATLMPGADESAMGTRFIAACDVRDTDAVIVAAGVFELRGIDETGPTDWARVLEINLGGAYRVAHAVAPLFRAEKDGSLVHFSIQIGLIGHRRATDYAASKGGVNSPAKTLALAFAPFGARANAVAPGPIETPMTALARDDPERHAGLIAAVPLCRWGAKIKPRKLRALHCSWPRPHNRSFPATFWSQTEE